MSNGDGADLNSDSQGSVRIQRVKHHTAASERKKKIVRNLGKAEVMVGTLCLILGIIIVVIAKTSPDSSGYRTIGEGIWAPIFGIIAGVFGTLAGGKKSTGSKVNAHLGTGALAALFAFVLMCIDSNYSLSHHSEETRTIYSYGVTSLAFLSFFNMVLLIVSTTYACCMIDGCICCCDVERREGYVGSINFSKSVRRNPFSRGPVRTQPKN